jgi:hypothetical protein
MAGASVAGIGKPSITGLITKPPARSTPSRAATRRG